MRGDDCLGFYVGRAVAYSEVDVVRSFRSILPSSRALQLKSFTRDLDLPWRWVWPLWVRALMKILVSTKDKMCA